MNLAPLTRLPISNVAPAGDSSDQLAPNPRVDAAARAEITRLRGMVAACLDALARAINQRLAPAIEGAHRAWEKVDDLSIVDPILAATVSETRRALHRAAAATGPSGRPVAAVAIEGLLALDSACGLTGLAERRLSSLIRLRVRSADPALLPQGRPFLDLGRAIAEVAREWS